MTVMTGPSLLFFLAAFLNSLINSDFIFSLIRFLDQTILIPLNLLYNLFSERAFDRFKTGHKKWHFRKKACFTTILSCLRDFFKRISAQKSTKPREKFQDAYSYHMMLKMRFQRKIVLCPKI